MSSVGSDECRRCAPFRVKLGRTGSCSRVWENELVSLSCSIATPISFGFCDQMHHDFESKQLLDILSFTGYLVSYHEVRRFLTSVAKDELSSSEVYI